MKERKPTPSIDNGSTTTATGRRQQSLSRHIYFISIMTDWRTGSGSLTASKMRKQGSDRSAEQLACTRQPDSLPPTLHGLCISIPLICIETTFFSLEKVQMQVCFKQSNRNVNDQSDYSLTTSKVSVSIAAGVDGHRYT